ncbi:MAG: PEGA domain-containing protein, partial [Myxococcales bacterium]|nr:PEGA domain-containing protein [Myxococcales bacterium]
MNRLPFLLLPLLLASPAFAQDATIAAPPLAVSGVPSAVGATFDAELRKSLSGKGKLLAAEAGSKSGVDGTCKATDCGKKLALAAGARFALTGTVVNNDEIYTVELSLYDAANDKQTKAKQVCELCGADDVKGSVAKAVKALTPALAAKAPPPKAPPPPPPPEENKVSMQVESVPDGADVLLDEKKVGQTPIGLQVKPGKHTVVVRKQGYLDATRQVSALDQTIKLMVTLVLYPTSGAAVPPPLPPPPAQPASPPPAAEAKAPVDTSGFTGVGWGLTVGGALAAGAGVWLVILDGEITCTDGRGRRECPNVYNTKGIGIPALGIGAAALGSGITLLIIDAL